MTGEFVKLFYFVRHLGKDFVVPGTKKAVLYGLVIYFVLNYAALIVVASVFWVA